MKIVAIEVLSAYDGEEIIIVVHSYGYKVVLPNSGADNTLDFNGYEEFDYIVASVTNIETKEKMEKEILTKYDYDLIEQAIRNYYE